MRWTAACIAAAAFGAGAADDAGGTERASGPPPIVIAHRGASGYLPEHTLEAYKLAIRQGADFIEPDLVLTADGALICRHENVLASVRLDAAGAIAREGAGGAGGGGAPVGGLPVGGAPVGGAPGAVRVLEATTDVADRPEFADRLRVKRVAGRLIGGWFTEDFTLAEIRTLFARERMPALRPASAAHDDRYRIPTLGEVVALIREEETQGRMAGIYPETKLPTYFRHEARGQDGALLGFDLSQRLARTLVELDFTDPRRVFIQSFEVANLVALDRDILPALGLRVPLIQLLGDVGGASAFAVPADVAYHTAHGSDLAGEYGPFAVAIALGPATTYADLVTPVGLAAMRQHYAAGIGPNKDQVLLRVREGIGPARLTGEVAPWLRAAQAEGLLVHAYTLRAEHAFASVDQHGVAFSFEEEARSLLALGVDGVFTDQPDLVVGLRARFLDSVRHTGVRTDSR